ncbi:MAG: hypothetical protein JST40_01010 [Armatimonadetes bacterium]|nr:hypothetical protein [Armatimonadota bacterium]
MKWLALACSAILLTGCARLPKNTVDLSSTRIHFKFKVDGRIRTGSEQGGSGQAYIYMVALRLSEEENPTDTGPIPIIGPPWGNGFVGGNATHFVQWDPAQANEFTIYKFINSDLLQWQTLGYPVAFQPVVQGTSWIEFEVALSQLEPDATQAAKIRSVQVNFLTMDSAPQTGNSKLWDALGDGRLPSEINQYLVIPLRANGLYTNQRAGGIEPVGDQIDPDLDMSDWSVEVRLQQ